MNTLTLPEQPVLIKKQLVSPVIKSAASNDAPGIIERSAIHLLIKIQMFFMACVWVRNPRKIWAIYGSMMTLKKTIWGGKMNKLYKIDGKYYYSIYAPSWPGKIANGVIKRELQRHTAPDLSAEKATFIFLAVTRKCPLRCEHCLEWDNLNQKESFTKLDLLETVRLYQQQGVLQIHFSGGEPMVRIKDLLEVISYASAKSECWVLTSGFNLTHENARLLKIAGTKGVLISIDHYIEELHNVFRGNNQSFQMAVNGVKNAKANGLVVALTVCATKAFLNGGHLLPYIEFAYKLGVQFVQVLEPRSVGHYEGKDVSYEEEQITVLEESFKMVNHDPAYSHYPTMMYHGYHQRRIGCFAGSRSVYIDSAGDVHACPFCHTSSYNIIEVIRGGAKKLPQKENACPKFGKVI